MHEKYLIGKHAPPNSNKFRLKVNAKKSNSKNNTGKKGHFLVEFDGLPQLPPIPPENLILFLVKSILLNYNNMQINNRIFEIPLDNSVYELSKSQVTSSNKEFSITNSWLVFRSYYSSSITQDITTQTDLSSVLSICWKNEDTIRELWSTFNRFYRNFRETSPEIKMNFQAWLNLKYNFPKDFLIVHKYVCDKLMSLFTSELQLLISTSGNYQVPEKNIKGEDLMAVSKYILDQFLDQGKKDILLIQALAKIDSLIHNNIKKMTSNI